MDTKLELFGRDEDISRLGQLVKAPGAKIIVVYGRRRVGKTTLLKHVFSERKLIFVEGLQGKNEARQREYFLDQVSEVIAPDAPVHLKAKNWVEVLRTLNEVAKTEARTIYLEEFQWMSAYRDNLVSELKYVWDNHWQKNDHLVLILCGSAPSFLIDRVMKSSALYNRSMHEFAVDPISLNGAHELLGKGRPRLEVLDAYLTVGGIPEYLKYLKSESSVFLSLLARSSAKDEYFVNEAERVFVSNLAKNAYYRAIIEYLATDGPSLRKRISEKLRIGSGGSTTKIFNDLVISGFVGTFANFSIGTKSRDNFYYLDDGYLDFYYSFIHPNLQAIRAGQFKGGGAKVLSYSAYRQWLGYRLERFCLSQTALIARKLGFGAVSYKAGPFLSKDASNGVQIDLIYKRKDKVMTICEVKYTDVPPGTEITKEFDSKLEKLSRLGITKGYVIQRVLISPTGAKQQLLDMGYFDALIDCDGLFL